MLGAKTCPPHKPEVIRWDEWAFGADEPWRSGEIHQCERCGETLPAPKEATNG